MRLAEFFNITEDYGSPGPHEMLDVACDAAEGGDPRWVDHLSDISDWLSSADFRSRAPDRPASLNAGSRWRADVHQQLDKAITYKMQMGATDDWKTYLDNIQNTLRDRARRHEI